MDGDQLTGAPEVSLLDDGAQHAARWWWSWSSLWQVPVLVLSVTLIAAGIWQIRERLRPVDLDGALDQVQLALDHGDTNAAAIALTEGVEPHLDDATKSQRGRFHTLVGDWLVFGTSGEDLERSRQIAEHYQAAAALGRELAPVRYERWIRALIAVDRLAEARDRLAALEMRIGGAGGDRLEVIRRRVLEGTLERGDAAPDELLDLLARYRHESKLAIGDERWAVAREAELLLDTGRTQEAVDRLLIDMRRLEHRSRDGERLRSGELYVLLGRGYLDLGEFEQASFAVSEAIPRLDPAGEVRGDAHLLTGRLANLDGDLASALEFADRVVRDFAGTKSFGPALQLRAHVRGVIGEHDEALADFGRLHDLVVNGGSSRLDRLAIVAELIERHDAALSVDNVETALRYVELADDFGGSRSTSVELVSRLAVTSRRRAEMHRSDGGPVVVKAYRAAARRYLRLAQLIRDRSLDEDDWAEAKWHAIECLDSAGDHDLAIEELRTYLVSRDDQDPRWPQVIFLLGQTHHAMGDYEVAADQYRQLIEHHPRSPFATRAAVPLARADVILGRIREAQATIDWVLSGSVIDPESVDYRDALLEAARLANMQRDPVTAVERLDEAWRRYRDDPLANEITFRLADALRLHGEMVDERLAQRGAVRSAERAVFDAIRNASYERAASLFAAVVADDDPGDRARISLRFRADCLYRLGRFADAIEVYDDLARAFPTTYDSLHALIQIHNAYAATGNDTQAEHAHLRARSRLVELPDAAFAEPGALMDRRAWERWLAAVPVERTASVPEGG